MTFPTWVEVDLDALEHNLTEIRRRIGAGRKILLVVKADAYGHGAPEVSRVAVDAGVEMLGVATVHEGIELRHAGIRAPLLVLSPTLPSEIDDLLLEDIRASVSSLDYARALSERASALRLRAVVHVEVDTGMGRSGVDESEALALLRAVAALPAVTLEGVFTHFPDAAPGRSAFAAGQLERFTQIVRTLRAEGLPLPLAHAANSAALLSFPDAALDMVRPGLMAYGHTHTGVGLAENLQPVMALKSRIVLLKHVPAGHSISYDRTYTTTAPATIAVVPAGYGHGVSTQLSNRGRFLVRGRSAPIVGRVTMDMTMVDVSAVPDVAVGDEVVLFGGQDGARISVEEVARQSETLSYDVLISIGKRVPRVFTRGSVPTMVKTLVGESRR